MLKIAADWIFTALGPARTDSVLILNDHGKVLSIEPFTNHDPSTIRIEKGALVPGFINTHCHLELSHMKGVAPTGTGLLPFLRTVVNYRDVAEEEILDAIQKGDEEMWKNGIVAVGDISNKLDTADCKSKSPIQYYTFVEMFDFLNEGMTQQAFQQYQEVYQGQATGNGNRKSAVPHAPYTVSADLFSRINQLNQGDSSQTISIHNQETAFENELFETNTGDFRAFYTGFGFPIPDWLPTGQPSIFYALEHMDPAHRTLFVHNTMTDHADVKAAHAWSENVYWATCPNANLYIENRLPNYQVFLDENAKVTVGTDSLTSNWQLSILEELKAITKYQSYIPMEILIRWACLNGAEALGFDDKLGSFEPGKKPGVNLITALDSEGRLTSNSQVQKLA